MNEPEIQLTDALRSLAAELDELGNEAEEHVPEIPDFRLTDVLGRGGMGTVYLAQQLSLGREVALKVVNCSVDGIVDEARTVAQLHHPHIVQVYAAGTAQDQSWFAMELMRGKTANHSPFASTEDVARLGVQIAEALAYAHRCGVIHRDVKPSNIFIGENGMAKLGDFGLANSTGDGGTRRYMAPEMLDGCKAPEASDQYALGVTLQELAHKGKQLEQLETTKTSCSMLSKLFPNSDFEAICAKATAQDPSRRYESMDAMLDDLRRFLANKPVAANPPSLFRRFRLFARRNPLAASGIVAASLLLAAFVAALAIGYIRTSRALAATEREAASAAQSLAMVVTTINVENQDKRDAEITRALTVAEHLAERFPENAEIADAVEELKAARDAHARFLERRGSAMRLQHRFHPAPRREQ
ncbi:MAG: serine/threonine protein kinase [Kiritimatiellae bacterium]|nr:serine/threonine protein kinase [Kiritimatiellia bacterium]